MPQAELDISPSIDAAVLRTLIDDLLDEQQRLTAVERFSRRHEAHTLPAHARHYRDLIPRSIPGEGQQYAFAVDLDVCTGCKGCVSACHSLNGLDEDELWRNVGLLHSAHSPYQQTITTACHHCVDPACMNGCPVLAYEKDPVTGIVRHLDDQCIGCQYCVLKCPYEVPKYSKTRGIVRKCDMCSARLAEGEAPACVQACPNGAITIGLINRDALRNGIVDSDRLLPGTVTSTYTLPTTTYLTRRTIPPDVTSGAGETFQPQDAHWPLVAMLLLTQMGVGVFAVAAFVPGSGASQLAVLTLAGACLLHLGLAVSTLHLGRPLGAWRAFLGLRRSWMSREIVAFGTLAPLALLSAFAAGLPVVGHMVAGGEHLAAMLPTWARAFLAGSTALVGVAAVFCSAMIYIDTRRPSWSAGHTLPGFFGTMIALGAVGSACLLAWLRVSAPSNPFGIAWLAIAGTVICAAILARDIRFSTPAWSRLHLVYITRGLLWAAASGIAIASCFTAPLATAWLATVSTLFLFLEQVCARYLYFVTSVPFKMPGSPSMPQAHHS